METTTAQGQGRFPRLAAPGRLGPVQLRNRVVMLAHGTGLGASYASTDDLHHYYVERARGGVGLIVTGSQTVAEHGRHDPRVSVDAADPAAVASWRPTIDALHRHETKFFAQLSHMGAEASSAYTMLPLWGASSVASPAVGENVHAVTLDEIGRIQSDFARCAELACGVGFDGVELKVAHDGIMRGFLSPRFNRRDDGYGGSPEARARMIIETLAAMREVVPRDRALGIRFVIDEAIPGGYGEEEGLQYAQLIARSGLVDYFAADMGTWSSSTQMYPPMGTGEGVYDELVGRLTASVGGLPVVAFGGLRTPAHAEQILATGKAEFVGMARQLIADPEWARKAFDDRVEDIRPCVACNQECVMRLLQHAPISCVHNPAAGREGRLGVHTRRAASAPRRVVVVGGGPSGLKAAEVAAERGHQVVLLERSEQLGGQVAVAATAPGHDQWGNIVRHLAGRVSRLGVDVRLGVEATSADIAAEHPDAVVYATGAVPGPWPFEVRSGVVLDEWSIMAGSGPRDSRVVVVDMGVRFEASALVETLVERGNEVHWLASARTVPVDVEPAILPLLLRGLDRVDRRPETIVTAVDGDAVQIQNVFTGRAETLAGVSAVVVVGNKVSAATPDGVPEAVEVHRIGDCVAPRHTAIAIYEGEIAGRAV